MKIVIVGAGIGGLVAALRLHRAGIDCTVYEQADQIRELGVGINLLPHAVKELAALDLRDRLADVAIRTDELRYTHRLGQEILRRPCGAAAGFSFPQFSIHRGRLQTVLLRAVRERLGPGAVRTGHRLVGFEQDADGVLARFADRLPARGDVLVGADGIHSTVRSRMFPGEGPPRWNGVTIWRGATDWPEYDGGSSMVIAGGQRAKLVVYPIADGQQPGTKLTNWAICVPTGRAGDPPPDRQDWSRPAEPADLHRLIDRFRLPYLDHAGLVMATREPFVFPMCDRDPLPFWSQGRVTLLGDAAHPMYPMGSNGAGQAILDVTSLTDHLANDDDPARALRAYQDERLPATSEVIMRNRRGGPEEVIDIVETRAPDGFTHLHDVIDPAELESIVTSYARVAGASQQQVNSPAR
jgi:5-methylphenazine-1-carboxylate 1-monooxygenase